jgi:hypothetical protein
MSRSKLCPTTADPVRALYQTVCVAVRMIVEIGFVPRRDGAVAFIDNPGWF